MSTLVHHLLRLLKWMYLREFRKDFWFNDFINLIVYVLDWLEILFKLISSLLCFSPTFCFCNLPSSNVVQMVMNFLVTFVRRMKLVINFEVLES